MPEQTPLLLLTKDELVAITGFKRARDQAAWIRDHYGIIAVVNAANDCVVVRAHLEAATVRGAGEQTIARMRIVRRQK